MLRYIFDFYLFMAVLVTVFVTTYVLARGRVHYMKAFSALSFCISVYLLGYLLEYNSGTLEQMIFWNQVQYFGLAFFPTVWLSVTLLYTRRFSSLRGWTLMGLFLIPSLTLLFRITNPYHYLYYTVLELRYISGSPILYLGKGPWYYIHSAYLLISLGFANLLLFIEYRKSSDTERTRYGLLLIASLLPYAGFIVILLGLVPLGLDYGALLMPISVSLIMFTMVKFDFLEIKSLAREAIFEASPDGMILMDNDSRIQDYNRAGMDFFMSQNKSLSYKRIDDILGDNQELIDVFKDEIPRDFQLQQGEQSKHFEIRTSVMHNKNGSRVGLLKSLRDITEKKDMDDKLRILSTVDELSGLRNRRNFIDLSQAEFDRTKIYGQCFSVVMMDIDHFKSINDSKGHAAGDAVIREMGRLMKTSFREADVLGRLGGEEFAAILPNTTLVEAEVVAERFRKTISETKIAYDNAFIGFTISIGITTYFEEAESFDEILRSADHAMYLSKDRGRNIITSKETVAT